MASATCCCSLSVSRVIALPSSELPATRGATAAEAATAAPKTTPSKTATAETAATPHATQQRAEQQGATSAPASAAPSADDEDRHQHEEEAEDAQTARLLRAHRHRRAHRHAFQRVATEDLDHRLGAFGDAPGEVALLERGHDDAVDDQRRLRIGQASFEPVADLDAHPPVIPGDDQQ